MSAPKRVSLAIKQATNLVKVSLKGEGEYKRSPLRLVIGADVSGSMAGYKMQHLKLGLKKLTSLLNECDRFSLYSYSSETSLLLEQVTGKDERLGKVIDDLQDQDSTNFYDALNYGYKVASDQYQDDAINAIILMSDGAPTSGKLTGVEDLIAHQKTLKAETDRKGQKIILLTYGIGHDYNGHFMKQLADNGDGSFYYIAGAEGVTEAIEDGIRIMREIRSQTNSIVIRHLAPRLKVILHSLNNFKMRENIAKIGPLYDLGLSMVFQFIGEHNLKPGDHLCTLSYQGQHNDQQYDLTYVDVEDGSITQYVELAKLVAELEADLRRGTGFNRRAYLDKLEAFEKIEDLRPFVMKYYTIINSYSEMENLTCGAIARSSSNNAGTIDDLYSGSSKRMNIASAARAYRALSQPVTNHIGRAVAGAGAGAVASTGAGAGAV